MLREPKKTKTPVPMHSEHRSRRFQFVKLEERIAPKKSDDGTIVKHGRGHAV
jgi:hypothetical protein